MDHLEPAAVSHELSRGGRALLKSETSAKCSIGHLELVRSRFGRRQAMLKLVTRTRDRTRGSPERTGHAGGGDVAEPGSQKEWPDHVRATALVLLLALLPVLVGSDRDVLRAVVGGELGAAQR